MGVFSKLFKKKSKPSYNQLKLVNFDDYSFNGNSSVYDSDVIRSCINRIATDLAQIQSKHTLLKEDGDYQLQKDNIYRLLNLRPNGYMSAFDFYYHVVTNLYLKSNVFIYVEKDRDGKVIAFYPIKYNTVKILETGGEWFLQFSFMKTGETLIANYDSVIHLRRYYHEDIYGSQIDKVIQPNIDLINANNASMKNAMNNSGKLRGILKVNTQLNDDDLKRKTEKFVQEYMNIQSGTGIGGLDAKMEYQELKNIEFNYLNEEQTQQIKEKTFNFFNVNQKIVEGNFNENEFLAYMSTVIEPLTVQMQQEFTYKVFSKRELELGNEIQFDTRRLMFANVKTKIAYYKAGIYDGWLSQNDVRSLEELPRIQSDAADIYRVNLNSVSLDKADEYQLGKAGVNEGGDDSGQAENEED